MKPDYKNWIPDGGRGLDVGCGSGALTIACAKRNPNPSGMKNLTSRQKILFGVWAMLLAMIGDYLLGFGAFSTSSAPEAYMGMTANLVIPYTKLMTWSALITSC